MCENRIMLVLLLLASVYSALWISGDAGEQWSKEKAEEMCSRNDVAAVYICLGNVVNVVWKDTKKGSTFYKPDGRIVECPPLTPAEMGAECMQLMMPNYCTLDDNVCGEAPPEEFPGGKTEGEIIYEGTPQKPSEKITPMVEVEERPPQQESQPPSKAPKQEGPIVVPFAGSNVTPKTTATEGQVFDALALGVIALAIIAIVLLYLAFKRMTPH
ncbi:MAG: hypothetical protein QW590_03685 [Candidatus Bilamarchaeaceae archaeon]